MTTPPQARVSTTVRTISAPAQLDHNRPRISVVIASRAEPDWLSAWLPAMAAQCEAAAVELIVVRTANVAGLRAQLRHRGVSVVFAGAEQTEDTLRSVGLAAASGDIILLVGDDHEIPRDWVSSVVARSRRRVAPVA
jgi:hypothetical protein